MSACLIVDETAAKTFGMPEVIRTLGRMTVSVRLAAPPRSHTLCCVMNRSCSAPPALNPVSGEAGPSSHSPPSSVRHTRPAPLPIVTALGGSHRSRSGRDSSPDGVVHDLHSSARFADGAGSTHEDYRAASPDGEMGLGVRGVKDPLCKTA